MNARKIKRRKYGPEAHRVAIFWKWRNSFLTGDKVARVAAFRRIGRLS